MSVCVSVNVINVRYITKLRNLFKGVVKNNIRALRKDVEEREDDGKSINFDIKKRKICVGYKTQRIKHSRFKRTLPGEGLHLDPDRFFV